MGADTSTLQSIDALSRSLADIETKLTVVENVHLHHERTISHDNKAFISGKLIECRPGASVTVGPVIGVVGCDSVRILVETSVSTELSFNFYSASELSTNARFLFDVKITVLANTPIAHTFTGFIPNFKYLVYLGGVEYADTITNYASFTTLPIEPGQPLRFYFTHHGCVDRAKPGEVNLWGDLEADVTSCPPNTNTPSSSSSSSSSFSSLPISEFTNVHMVIHNGDLVSVDSFIYARILELMDIIMNEDTPSDTWIDVLSDIEVQMRDAYRRALTHPSLRHILRRCGNVFIAGRLEAAMASASMLATAVNDEESTAAAERELKEVSTSANAPQTIAAAEPMTKKAKKKAAAAALAAEEERKRPKKRGEDIEEPTDIFAEDGEVPAVGGVLRRLKEVTIRDIKYRTEYGDEMKKAVIGAIVRLARRVSWSYMRQLWDENYEEFSAVDLENEQFLRNIVILRKKIEVMKLLFSHLDRTRLKLLREFGSEYNAADRLVARCSSMQEEIKGREAELLKVVERCQTFREGLKDPPNGFCLKLGRILLLGLETSWGILSKMGEADRLHLRQCPINGEILNRLDKFTGMTPTTKEDLAELMMSPSGTGLQSLLLPDVPIDTIVFVSSCQALPVHRKVVNLQDEDVNAANMFVPSAVDGKALLQTLARWQQRDNDRTVVVAMPNFGCTAEGYITPIIVPDKDDNQPERQQNSESTNDTPEIEGWNELRCRLRTVLLSEMDRKSSAPVHIRDLYESCPIPCDGRPVSNADLGFAGVFQPHSISFRRSYWEAVVRPLTPPQPSTASSTGWVAGNPSKVEFKCLSDEQKCLLVPVSLGPIIGRVTPHSCVVLLETCVDGHLEVLCIDKITGIQHSTVQCAVANQPTLFSFENLMSNRAYDVVVNSAYSAYYQSHRSLPPSATMNTEISTTSTSPIAERAKEVIKAGMVRGSFTTLRKTSVPYADDDDRVVVANLRSQVSGSATEGGGIPEMADSANNSEDSKVKRHVFKCLCVGSNQPSWRQFVMDDDQESEHQQGQIGTERMHVLGCIELARNLGDVVSKSWNGVDLVIHCGHNVDLMPILDVVLGSLQRLEELTHELQIYSQVSQVSQSMTMAQPRNSYTVMHQQSLQDEASRTRHRVEEGIRQAYRMHWGATSARTLLAHGNHLFVSSPLLDVLHACHARSLRQLTRDLTPFCVRALLETVSKLEAEYQDGVWQSEWSPSRNQFSQSFMDGKLVVFTLKPRVVFAQDGYGSLDEGLIPEEQFTMLSACLAATNLQQLPPETTVDDSVASVLIVSPLPLVKEDRALTDLSGLTASEHLGSVAYTSQETARLLDIVSYWMQGRPNRHAALLVGGGVMSAGFRTDIKAFDAAEYTPGLTTSSACLASIPQLCVGPLVGIRGDDPLSDPLVTHASGSLVSPTRTYSFTHVDVCREPHVGIIGITHSESESASENRINVTQSGKSGSISQSFWTGSALKRTLSAVPRSGRAQADFKVTDRYNQPIVQLLERVNTHIEYAKKSTGSGGDKAKKAIANNNNHPAESENIDLDAIDASKLIRKVCHEYAHLLKDCHMMLKSLQYFDLPLNNAVSVEETFMAATTYFMRNLPLELKMALSPPSSFAIRKAWQEALKPYERLKRQQLEDEDGDRNASQQDGDQVISPPEIVAACLCSDVDYFARFVREVFETQTLCEYFTFALGVQDGWEQSF